MRYGYESKLSHNIPGTLSHSWLKKRWVKDPSPDFHDHPHGIMTGKSQKMDLRQQ